MWSSLKYSLLSRSARLLALTALIWVKVQKSKQRKFIGSIHTLHGHVTTVYVAAMAIQIKATLHINIHKYCSLWSVDIICSAYWVELLIRTLLHHLPLCLCVTDRGRIGEYDNFMEIMELSEKISSCNNLIIYMNNTSKIQKKS